jgi:PST family polysaccharide transporter
MSDLHQPSIATPASSLSAEKDDPPLIGGMVSLGRNSWVALAGGLLSQALKFLVIVYVARSYGATEFGSFSFASSVNAFMFVTSQFGLPVFGAREVAQTGSVDGALVRSISEARLLLAVAGTAVALAVLFLIPGVKEEELLLVLGFGLSNMALAFLYDWAFQGQGKLHGWAALNVVWQLLWLAFAVTVVHTRTSIVGVSFAYAAGALVAAAVGWMWLRRKLFSRGTRDSSSYSAIGVLSSGIALGMGSMLITVLAWSDTIFVRLISGAHTAGIYAAGNRGTLALAMLGSFYVLGAFSHLTKSAVESPEDFQRYFGRCYRELALLFIPGAIWSIFYAPEILLLVFKHRDYLAAVPVFRIFQIVLLINVISNLEGVGVIVSHRRDHVYRRSLAASASLLLVLCPILTLHWGDLGAAIAALIGQAFCLLLFQVETHRLVRMEHLKTLAIPVLLGIGTAGIGFALHLPFWGACGLICFVYFGVFILRGPIWLPAEG